jgi:hypothetical protein
LLVALCVAVPPAGAASDRATLGGVTAVFSYRGTFPESHGDHMTISKGGKVLYSKPVSSPWCLRGCWPNVPSSSAEVVHIVQLQANGPPDVVLDLYSGGAHCCSIEQVFSLLPASQTYRESEHDFGDPGVRLVKIGAGASDDFLSADDSFAYAFTDYAASGMPIEIFRFSDDAFHNVTRLFPDLIAKDARQWMQAFRAQASGHYDDTTGVVAAWAADEEMLGHPATVTAFLTAQARAGHLNSALSPVTPSDAKYVAALMRFMRRHGYIG